MKLSRSGNIKTALQSIRAARWRSFLTMLGVIIGVVSVVTTVSLGEGVKQQIRQQGKERGEDLITILPGKRVERNEDGEVERVTTILSEGLVFSEADFRELERLEEIGLITPFARVSGVAHRDNGQSFQGQIIATTEDLPDVLNQDVAYGEFFSDDGRNDDYAIIGTRVAEQLFGENVPMGKSFNIRDKSFIVRGVFNEFPPSGPLPLSTDYNRAIFIPYDVGRELMAGNIQVQQIMAKPASEVSVDQAAAAINNRLLSLHADQEDFTVLTQDETLLVAGGVLNLLTAMITAIAGISLFVGGIGIMNIMFVSVTERTNEIGVRKAVGATTRQIANQFLTEAVILSLIGGLIGVLLSILANFLLRVFTDLQPVITLPIMGLAVLVSVGVGVIFGVTPALRAAQKDPIEALRYE